MIFSISCSSLQRSQNTADGDNSKKNKQIKIKIITLVEEMVLKKKKRSAVTRIFHHFFRSFPLHLSGDVLDVISAPLLVGFDELVEVALVPDGESLP